MVQHRVNITKDAYLKSEVLAVFRLKALRLMVQIAVTMAVLFYFFSLYAAHVEDLTVWTVFICFAFLPIFIPVANVTKHASKIFLAGMTSVDMIYELKEYELRVSANGDVILACDLRDIRNMVETDQYFMILSARHNILLLHKSDAISSFLEGVKSASSFKEGSRVKSRPTKE